MTTEEQRDIAVNALRLLVHEIKIGKARQFIRMEDRQVAEDVLTLLDPVMGGQVIYFLTADGVVVHDPMACPGSTLMEKKQYWLKRGVKLDVLENGLRRWSRVFQPKR